jgi:hypothetical protein
VFRSLSLQARFELIDRHLKTHQLSFAESCLDMVERQGTQRKSGITRLLDQRRAALVQARLKSKA